jgi:hypothetical protein
MDDIMAEMPEASAVSLEAEVTFHAPEMPGAMARTVEIVNPAQIELPRLTAESPALQAVARPMGNGAVSNDGIGADKEPDASNPEDEKPADAELAAPRAAAAAKPKANLQRPNIFVPGPAPDDPGPRPPEADEVSTPLSRFRRPT